VPDLIHLVRELLPPSEPWRSLARTSIFLIFMTSLLALIEGLSGADLGRYRRRAFLNDVLYTVFYQGGLYNLLIYVPIFSYVQKQLAFADLHLLSAAPGPVQFIAYWLIADFLGYWIHRLQHANPFLWAFHSVHHVPTEITFATSSRNHLLDQLLANLFMFIPILILGTPRSIWLPFLIFHTLLEALQHANLAWKYGPFYRVLVSPLFHNLHHSRRSDEYNGNYSKILSTWDFVFGTAVERERLPEQFGVEGYVVAESLAMQFIAPFKKLLVGRQRAVDTVQETGPA